MLCTAENSQEQTMEQALLYHQWCDYMEKNTRDTSGQHLALPFSSTPLQKSTIKVEVGKTERLWNLSDCNGSWFPLGNTLLK